MIRFLIDEDMPRSTAPLLIQHGFPASDVRDIGLRSASDESIYAYAQKHGLTILTRDRGFGDIIRFPLSAHHGILVIRFPNETPTKTLNKFIVQQIVRLSETEIRGNVIIIDSKTIRIRRKEEK
ncbi:MAG: hypothetical protein EPO24_14650 [Bacteroidetes bacterium]|nr:MAG: hypothetical protein EPO24_14650 [Bacteroidota bacterium]